MFDAIVGKDGFVRDAKVIRSEPMLDEAALTAVRQWRYSISTLNREPVEVVMSVTVIFSLK